MTTMTKGETLESILDRHRAFWTLAPVERPLIAKVPTREWEGKPYPLKGGRAAVDVEWLEPDDVDVERLVGGPGSEDELLVGDLLTGVRPMFPQAWMEALIGCPISVSAYGCVSQPARADVVGASESFSVATAVDSDWAHVMDRVLVRATALAHGRMPVHQLHLRGIIDMLAAYLGEARLCMAIYDAPEALELLQQKFVDLHLATAWKGLGRRSPWRGGFVSSWNLYAPGPFLDYQIDASSLFSPQAYEAHFLQADRRVLGAFPYSVLHLHAVGLYLIDVVLKIEEATAIEISLDRETGVWEKGFVMECCQKIQARGRSLILSGELTEDEAREFVSSLSPWGLALYYWNP